MCELFAMCSRLPATVTFSLEELARHGGLTAPNRDGWGVAYYDDGDVRLIREPEPAADSEFVEFLEQHEIYSTIVVSHIRRATQGERRLKNTQPFCRELGGRTHVFAHNGDLGNVVSSGALELGHFRPIGDTDSEHAFCALLHRVEPLWLPSDTVPDLSERLHLFREFTARMRALGSANVVYSDGDAVFVHGHKRRGADDEEPRPPGAHVLCRSCTATHRLAHGGVRVHPGEEEQDVVLVASVPLTREAWSPLAEGEILVLQHGEIVFRGVDETA